jgi:hypothetical protein
MPRGKVKAGLRKAGQYIGGQAGNIFGDMFSRVTGFGDYDVRSNSLVAPTVVPEFGPNSVRITHKEYLGNVDGSVAFKGLVYPLNPGISTTFPWLSAIARNYQQYRMNGLIFQYVSTSAFALGSTNSALGKVILATNYNAEDDPFISTVGMLATQFSNYARPADAIMHAIECAPTETASNVYYIRTDLDGKQKDLRLTDIGFTEIGVEGMQSTTEVGGLWVTYDVTLMKPILNPKEVQSDGFDQFAIKTNVDDFYHGKITPRNNYLGGTMLATDTSYQYAFPPQTSVGTYLVCLEIIAAADNKVSAVAVGYDTFGTTNATQPLDDDKNGPFAGAATGRSPCCIDTLKYPPFSYTDSNVVFQTLVTITGDNAHVDFYSIVQAGPGLEARLSVWPISYDSTPQEESPV